jgi:DNA (cytosine-5)-methyltransferase 1
LKVLNLYSGIGGNRKLWENVEVTAVEYNEEIAAIYQEYFPNDKVIVADAHEYLLKHYKEFDFIWSSPPCQTHSRTNYFLNAQGIERYPDMKLYQEIIFLQSFFKGKYVVENVIGYYEPLINPQQIERHYFWANFKIISPAFKVETHVGRMCGKKSELGKAQWEIRQDRQKGLGFDLTSFDAKDKDQMLRNCVNPDLGLYILEQAQGIIRQEKTNQLGLFNTDAA